MTSRLLALLALPPLLTLDGAPAAQDDGVTEEVRSYFVICDRDGNGWISYREARDSLSLDRDEFAAFDSDGDGRVDLREFRTRFAEIADRVGLLPKPRAVRPRPVDLPREPEQILTAYDLDSDEGIEERELARMLDDYGRSEIAAAVAMEKLDEDADGVLRTRELELLSRLLATLYVAGPDGPESLPAPKSVVELFGRVVPRPGGIHSTPQPPLIVGPVPIFRRLDLDDDGGIEVEDLRGLLSPLQLPISLSAIQATLDTDEDGRVDPDELDAALGARRR
jgi:Ca2+-binding EF-hand superfamily protein